VLCLGLCTSIVHMTVVSTMPRFASSAAAALALLLLPLLVLPCRASLLTSPRTRMRLH
jgi:ABC-type phosphate transport system permease subunit